MAKFKMYKANFHGVDILVPPQFGYVVMDENKCVCLHEERPSAGGQCWASDDWWFALGKIDGPINVDWSEAIIKVFGSNDCPVYQEPVEILGNLIKWGDPKRLTEVLV